MSDHLNQSLKDLEYYTQMMPKPDLSFDSIMNQVKQQLYMNELVKDKTSRDMEIEERLFSKVQLDIINELVGNE